MASADAIEIDGIYYEFDNENQEAFVVKNPNRYVGNVVIPEKVSFDGTEYTVTAIEGAAFGYCDGLTSVIIPKSVTFIGGYAFSRCKSLTAIVLPDALERIANHAFFMSENLSTLNISAGVTYIGECAFSGCPITDYTIPKGITAIYQSAFNSTAVSSVIIPEKVESIGEWAFRNCRNLESVVIPASVTSIGEKAFGGCDNLTSVTVYIKNPLAIPEDAFSNRTNATLMVPVGCKEDYLAADYWKEFKEIVEIEPEPYAVLSEDKTTLTFYYDMNKVANGGLDVGPIKLIQFPGMWLPDRDWPAGGLTTVIFDSSFADCSSITSTAYWFYLCSDLTTIKGLGNLNTAKVTDMRMMFSGCSALETILCDNAWNCENSEGMFNGCTSLKGAISYDSEKTDAAYANPTTGYFTSTNYKVGDVFTVDGMTFMVTSIEPLEARVGKGTLNGMNGSPAIDVSIEGTVVIPSSVTGDDGNIYAVTSIGASAFANCGGVTSVIIPNSVTAISAGFDWGGSAFAGGAFENCGLTTLIIPSTVTSIGQGAFSGCSNLVSIVVEEGNTVYDSRNNCNAIIVKETNDLIAGCKNTVIPDGVTSIGNGAFSGCKGLMSLELPSSVTYIGTDGFKGCSDLTSIGISGVTGIHYGAFEGCSALTSIVIPEGVTGIWQYTFWGCSNLTTITIPKGMKWIGRNTYTGFFNSTFWGCSSLTDVYCYADEVPEVNAKVFEESNIANATLYVPAGCSEAYSSAEGWKDFKEIKEFVNDESAAYIIEDDKTVTIINEIISTEKEIEVPVSVTIDGETYPVTGIGEMAYANNTIMEQVTIPETIEKIGDAAFAGCTSLKVIYSYAKEPIPLGSAKAKVRTRADGEEISASTVFAEVDKETCVLYVPFGSADKYKAADGWSEFKNIVEMDSDILGDANNDGKVDADDIDAITRYIMEGDDEGFIFKNADVNGDEKINAADIVEVVNIIKANK